MFDIFHDNIYINEAVKKKKRKKYVFKYPCILWINVKNKVEVLLLGSYSRSSKMLKRYF